MVGVRPVILLAIGVVAALLGFAAATGSVAPVRVSKVIPTTSTVVPATSAPATTVAEPTTTDDAPVEAVEVEGGLADEGSSGLVVTNSGSATADVGGNVVSGSSGGDVGIIVSGDATAIGNRSSVGGEG